MTAPLRLAFMGAPDFAIPSLAALLDAGHDVVRVYSQPPRPAGRGHHETPTPVAAFAAGRGLEVATPRSLKEPAEQAAFRALGLDAAVVVAYGLILPPAILAAPRLGCLNVHASLLPRWRGAAPIQRAILAGDRESGVSIMLMDEGLDTGPLLAERAVPITSDATGASLHDRLAAEGAKLLVPTLAAFAAGEVAPRPQPTGGVTYAAKLRREESRLDWHRPAVELERQVRAFTPWPGSHFELEGQRIKVLKAMLARGGGPPGEVAPGEVAPGEVVPGEILPGKAVTVACGEGALRLVVLQRQGKAALPAETFVNGFPLPPGTRLG